MKILIIQTAFIGDVILATPVLEELHRIYPDAVIHFLLRKGNEGILENHPFLNETIIWDKKKDKFKNLFRIKRRIRNEKYDLIVNLQRFASSGYLTAFSGAKEKIGFDKNPFSSFYTKKIKHVIGDGRHEVERNLDLIQHLGAIRKLSPKMYPSSENDNRTKEYKSTPYICIAPASVWFTKQLPEMKWRELIRSLGDQYNIYMLGAPGDSELCDRINKEKSDRVINLCGKLSFLDSASLMKDAKMNYVNDSAPLHICSAVNAPVTAFFCSTLPSFGFGPLSDNSTIKEFPGELYCRPCGLHGRKNCPEGHFRCALEIPIIKD